MNIITDQFHIILALLFGCALLWVAFRNARVSDEISVLSFCLLSLAGVYGFGWAVVAHETALGRNYYWGAWLHPAAEMWWQHTLYATVAATAIICGWKSFGFSKILGRQIIAPVNYAHLVHLKILFWAVLAAAVIAQGLYTYALGGYVEALHYSRAIRNGNITWNNGFSYLLPFGGFSIFSSIGFLGLWLEKRRDWNAALGFGVATAFSFYVLYSWLWRIGLLSFALTLLLAFVLRFVRKPVILMVGVIIGGIALVGLAFVLSAIWSVNSETDPIYYATKELSFPFVAFFVWMKAGEPAYRWFFDYVAIPLYALPSSLWSSWLVSLEQQTTFLAHGLYKGEGTAAGIPADIISAGYAQAGWLGVAVVSFAYGCLIRFVNELIKEIANPGLRSAFFSLVAIKLGVLALFYAAPTIWVRDNFFIVVPAMGVLSILWLHQRIASHYRRMQKATP